MKFGGNPRGIPGESGVRVKTARFPFVNFYLIFGNLRRPETDVDAPPPGQNIPPAEALKKKEK